MMTISCVSYGRVSSYESIITLTSFVVVVVETIDVVVVAIVSLVASDVISVTSVEVGVVVVSIFVDDYKKNNKSILRDTIVYQFDYDDDCCCCCCIH